MQYELFSNKGSRELNEDYISMASRDNRYLFVLADGLGGHGRGEVASQLVVEDIIDYYKDSEKIPTIEECIDHAQKRLLEKQEEEHDKEGMKTTIVVLEIADGKVKWAHVGDSRLYMFYKSKMVTRTLDHSVPQMLVSAGDIKEKDIRGHEDRNRLLRVVGMEWTRPMYTSSEGEIPVKSGQAFLLCTDGFWELIEEKTMEKLLKKAVSAKDWVEKMAQAVQEQGVGKDMDNFSAIVVWLEK